MTCERIGINACKGDVEMKVRRSQMKHMPRARQSVSFDVALVLEEHFLAGVFGELKTQDKISIKFPGSKSFLRFSLLGSWCNQHFSAEISKFNNKHILTTMLIQARLPFRWSMRKGNLEAAHRVSFLFPCLGWSKETQLAPVAKSA